MTRAGHSGTKGRAASSRFVPSLVGRSSPSTNRRILLLCGGLVLIGMVLARSFVAGMPGPAAPFHCPWWVLALGFAASESFAIHLPFSRDIHSISLSEIPLVFGLFFCGPFGLLAARILGAGASLLIHRRQRPIKLAFNL